MLDVTRTLELSVGVLSIIPALAITFVADHSLATGLLVFSLWALVTGVTASQLLRRAGERAWRRSWQLTELAGVVGLVLWFLGNYTACNWLIGVWALGFAVLTFVFAGRDTRMVGVFTALLALAQLLMPVNPVVNVGVFGAYLVVLGVWLVIGALSPRATLESEGASAPHA